MPTSKWGRRTRGVYAFIRPVRFLRRKSTHLVRRTRATRPSLAFGRCYTVQCARRRIHAPADLRRSSAERLRRSRPEVSDTGIDTRYSSKELADDIESLGLRKRTRYFREASEQLVEDYNSTVPNTRVELLELQGVGEYTAISVLAHAFSKGVAAVDTNVARILSRVFGLDCGDTAEASENWELTEELLPSGRSSDYIHALIDFGAEVCTASNPSCENCPLEGVCEYGPEESS